MVRKVRIYMLIKMWTIKKQVHIVKHLFGAAL